MALESLFSQEKVLKRLVAIKLADMIKIWRINGGYVEMKCEVTGRLILGSVGS